MNTRSASTGSAMAFGVLTPQRLALVLGIVNVLIGIIGFVPNPIVSANGLFVVNAAHNFVHAGTGLAFLAGALTSATGALVTIRAIAIAYAIVTIVGFMTPGDHLLGLIHINEADRWLHLGLAAAYAAAGFLLFRKR